MLRSSSALSAWYPFRDVGWRRVHHRYSWVLFAVVAPDETRCRDFRWLRNTASAEYMGRTRLYDAGNYNLPSRPSIEDVKFQFRCLQRSDPSFTTHVNLPGNTYLQELIQHGPWDCHDGHTFLGLFKFLAEELHITAGLQKVETVYSVANWAQDNCHLELLEVLIDPADGFKEADSPMFISWPLPCRPVEGLAGPYGPNRASIDPFYLSFITNIVAKNHEFGGTHPLHVAILHGDTASALAWINKLPNLEGVFNFLGQSPFYMALKPECQEVLQTLIDSTPETMDAADKWGYTPLMYAVAMGYEDAVSALIKSGARLSIKTAVGMEDGWISFIGCAFVWDHEDMLWRLINDIPSTARCNELYEL
ncbi:hypothetical protein B0T16DRAFT_106100 [Cercophora newfieldiana]|uniref:Ankyrin n=1 Tax=Cercophora newfieldiana TaxID=92897 RepID=A0AA40CXJ3_9PEZI|nr:hypothetical protein B0T16DRAFT_106100 [Cercophora newfieldiana]